MCQARVIMKREQGEEVILDEVVHMRIEDGVVWLARLFEEPVAVRAAVQEADFLEHTVTLIPRQGDD